MAAPDLLRARAAGARPVVLLPRLAGLLPWAGAAVGAVTIVYGQLHARELGATEAPFFGGFDPIALGPVAVAAAVLAVGVVAGLRLLRTDVPAAAFAAAATALALVTRVALNVTRGGVDGLWAELGKPQTDYLPALPALRLGVPDFLDRFAELSPSLPIHPSAHPPGTLLLLHATGISSDAAFGVLLIVAGALAVPATYALARELLEERGARLAALFVAFSPAMLLYGATSPDALFAVLAVLPGIALLARHVAWRATGPPLVLLASFFSYPLPGAAAWALLVTAGRDGLRRAVAWGAACALALVAGCALLYALTGFDMLGAVASAESAYRRGIAGERPYAYWLFGSPTAWFVFLGLPLAWLVLREASRGALPALALLAIVVIAAVLGFTKAETERIWLFLVPLACVAAASAPRLRAAPVLSLLALQALATQAIFDTRF